MCKIDDENGLRVTGSHMIIHAFARYYVIRIVSQIRSPPPSWDRYERGTFDPTLASSLPARAVLLAMLPSRTVFGGGIIVHVFPLRVSARRGIDRVGKCQ